MINRKHLSQSLSHCKCSVNTTNDYEEQSLIIKDKSPKKSWRIPVLNLNFLQKPAISIIHHLVVFK